jgi:hypothetical protein
MRPRREHHRPATQASASPSPSNCLPRWLSRWLRSADPLPGMITDDIVATIFRVFVVLLVLGYEVAADNLVSALHDNISNNYYNSKINVINLLI